MQICEKIHTAEELIARADRKFFQKSQFFGHCIHQLLFLPEDILSCFLLLNLNCLRVVLLIDVSLVIFSCACVTTL